MKTVPSSVLRLVNPTTETLDAAFAEHVAGWRAAETTQGFREQPYGAPMPRYTESFDAVLPYLDSWRKADRHFRAFAIIRSGHDYMVELSGDRPGATVCHDASLARAAVICLLRSNGVTVEITS